MSTRKRRKIYFLIIFFLCYIIIIRRRVSTQFLVFRISTRVDITVYSGANFRQHSQISDIPPPPPFALENTVFSPLLGRNFRKFVNFPWRGGGGGGGGGPPRFPPLTVYQHGKCFIFVKYKFILQICRISLGLRNKSTYLDQKQCTFCYLGYAFHMHMSQVE